MQTIMRTKQARRSTRVELRAYQSDLPGAMSFLVQGGSFASGRWPRAQVPVVIRLGGSMGAVVVFVALSFGLGMIVELLSEE
jgi:hypothetical protein